MFWKRLLFSYLFVILFALLFLGFVINEQINSSLKDEVIYSNELILENGSIIFSNFVQDIKTLALDIAVNEDIQKNLSNFNQRDALYINGSIADELNKDKYLTRELHKNGILLQELETEESKTTIQIYPIRDNLIYQYNEYTGAYFPLNVVEEHAYIEETYEKNGGFIMTSLYLSDGNHLIVTCNIYDVKNWSVPIGVLELDISADVINSLLYNIKLEKNISPYLIDDKGIVFIPYADFERIDSSIILNYSEEPVELENKIVLKRNVIATKWKIIGVLPNERIGEKLNVVTRAFIFTGALTIIILFFLSIYLANWLSNPLQRLARRLKQVEVGTFKPLTVKKTYSTEVKILYEQYNFMTQRIENLISQAADAAEKEKNAELLALQAQINPHFLYNTLDSIGWMAIKYKADDVRFMVHALAKMMRYSLNSGKNYISVRNEIEQVRSYVGIQEIRHNSKFKTFFNIDDSILDYQIIKLLLQPLVENAIRHGFQDTGNYGDIYIDGYICEENLVIEVVNEGDNLDVEKINAILHPENNKTPSSYGIRNVNDRLVTQYGELFELKIFIKDGKTFARIELPLNQLEIGENNE